MAVRFALNEHMGKEFLEYTEGKEFRFVLCIAYTDTAEIDGITVAGADKESIKYTPPADAEFLHYGKCRCIDTVPATPDGKPTPALITRAALRLAGIPIFIVDAGSKVKPRVRHYSLAVKHGRNIIYGNALDKEEVIESFNSSIELGQILARSTDCLVIGESIPAGTTTALAVMLSLGIDARFKVSSSMPKNPHDIKLNTVYKGMSSAGIGIGSLRDRPLEAITCIGDPMIPSVAGMTIGALKYGSRVLLAGGTQMAAILAVIKYLGNKTDGLAIATTSYVMNDSSADMRALVHSIDASVPLLYYDPLLHRSSKSGLRAYAEGFVKEGVGAGGACIAASAKSMHSISQEDILAAVEDEYERTIERIK
jgi:uncharacterized protein (TIGR00303 family)